MNLLFYSFAFLLLSISSSEEKFSKEHPGSSEIENPYGVSSNDQAWMRQATIGQLEGCRVLGAGDTWLHTPDGVGNYKALWTRDTYYMVEYAGDLMDQVEIKASIRYLLSGQRDDGCMPDRVNIAGNPVYSPGAPTKPMADHSLDNGPFMALLVCSYVNQFGDKELFIEVEAQLRKGLDFIRRKESGLVYNEPKNPECVYGFTDIVKKTGNLLFTSLIYYKACIEMEQLCVKYGIGNASVYKRRHEYIRQSINKLWDEGSGMFWAADVDCKQIDIWGSAYAVEVGVASDEQAKQIADYLINNYDQLAQRGQFRHLAGEDKGWNNLFKTCPEGTYQNGAYWATPLAWIVPTIAKQDLPLAKKIVKTVIDDFRENDINECINDDYVKIPNYVVSATNVYCLTR